MGRVSRKLVDEFQHPEQESAELAKQFTTGLNPDILDLEALLNDGYDPEHALYVIAQNFTSYFVEAVSDMDDLDEYSNTVTALEDEYLPEGPPMSPLTASYFTLSVFFDLQFGEERGTVGECLVESLESMDAPPLMVGVINNLCGSRMGIYEHCGTVGPDVRLRELITSDEFLCHSPTGYQGTEGELWYVRLCPPIGSDSKRYVVMTTPYVLLHSSPADWTAFLNKSLVEIPGEKRNALRDLLKYGQPLDSCSWYEFVFQAYHHGQYDAIFLAGLPDVTSSRPHADLAIKTNAMDPPDGGKPPAILMSNGFPNRSDRTAPTPAAGNQLIRVRFTSAQRRAIAALHGGWTDRLLLDQKNPRTIELTIAELKQLGVMAQEALKHATGHQRSPLKRIVAIVDKEYTAATAVRVYQLRIDLRHTDPSIWRRIQVEDCPLEDLHYHIQAAMGWDNSHLYKFQIRDTCYRSLSMFDDDGTSEDAAQTRISEVLPKSFRRFDFRYLYDFGDSWEHIITMEEISVAESSTQYPVCLYGENACPPEDCGGVGGFYDFVEAITNPEHEEHREQCRSFDPDVFDPRAATNTMRRGA